MLNTIVLIGMVALGIVAYEMQILHVGFELVGDGFHLLSDLTNSSNIM